MNIPDKIARELNLRQTQVTAAIELLDAGNTLPFIARYRKEATGSLDDEQLLQLTDRLEKLRTLDERRQAVIASIQEDKCSGCRICNSLCPFNAIEFVEDKKVSKINAVLCKGCGTCVGSCPSGSIVQNLFEDDEIFSEIQGVLAYD